jgi:hypothetical protein
MPNMEKSVLALIIKLSSMHETTMTVGRGWLERLHHVLFTRRTFVRDELRQLFKRDGLDR